MLVKNVTIGYDNRMRGLIRVATLLILWYEDEETGLILASVIW